MFSSLERLYVFTLFLVLSTASVTLNAAAGGKDKSGRKVREELKSSDQILKQRKIKERREQHLKNVRVKKAQRY